MIQIDQYVSHGLKPPTSQAFMDRMCSQMDEISEALWSLRFGSGSAGAKAHMDTGEDVEVGRSSPDVFQICMYKYV